MKKTILTTVITAACLIIAINSAIVSTSFFYNPKTKDNGIAIILKEHVYNGANLILRAVTLDDAGAIGDIKVPFTKQSYIVFEL